MCRPWFAFQATSVQIVSCAVDGIMMLRSEFVRPSHPVSSAHDYHVTVQALYNRNRRIAIFLLSLLVIQVLTMIFCVIFTVNALKFDTTCLPVTSPRLYLPLG